MLRENEQLAIEYYVQTPTQRKQQCMHSITSIMLCMRTARIHYVGTYSFMQTVSLPLHPIAANGASQTAVKTPSNQTLHSPAV